jgi:hypothetical protein
MSILPGGGPLLHLGLGLWRYPAYSALLEFAIVIAGSLLYWRAARRLAVTDVVMRRANLCGISVLAAGLITLGINLLGA